MIPGIVASQQMIAAGSGGGGGGGPFKVTITIPSGKVGSTLTGFPVMVRLSDMPAGFWTHCKADGGDIRVKTTAGVLVPMDLVRFDYESQDGVLFFLASSVASGADSSWDIHYGDDTLDLLPVDDTNGRNAVWAAYESVFLFGESCADDRTGGATATVQRNPLFMTLEETSTGDLNSHQGICWDGTYYYTTDTNAIYKWDASWTLVDSNTDPLGDAAIGGSPTVDHCGDLDVHDGKLYIPIECWPASGGLYNAHIGVFDASDLSFIQAFDISAQAHEASSIAYCDRDDLLYITDYDGNNTSLFKYDPTDGSYIGTLTTDAALTNRQGITFWRGSFWIAAGSGAYRVGYDGHVTSDRIGWITTTDIEGISHKEDALIQLFGPGTEYAEVWKPLDVALSAGGGVDANYHTSSGLQSTGDLVATGRNSYTTYTLGASMMLTSTANNRMAVSYWDESAGGTNTRQSMGYRASGNQLGIWDPGNSFLHASPTVNPTLSQWYRMHAVYEGTTQRKIYIDGSLGNTDVGITAVPAGLDTVRILSEDTSLSERWAGQVGFVYLYPGVLSADWIAAEYAMLNAPGSFYSVGSETTA